MLMAFRTVIGKGSQIEIQEKLVRAREIPCPCGGTVHRCVGCDIEGGCEWGQLFQHDLTQEYIGRKKTLRVVGDFLSKRLNQALVSSILNDLKEMINVHLFAYVFTLEDPSLIGEGLFEDGTTCFGGDGCNSHLPPYVIKSHRHHFVGVLLTRKLIDELNLDMLYDTEEYRDIVYGIGRGIIEFHGQHTISLYNVYSRYVRKEVIRDTIIEAVAHMFGRTEYIWPHKYMGLGLYYNSDGVTVRVNGKERGMELNKARCHECGKLARLTTEAVEVREGNSVYIRCLDCMAVCPFCESVVEPGTLAPVPVLINGEVITTITCPICRRSLEVCHICGVNCDIKEMYDATYRLPEGDLTFVSVCYVCLYNPPKEYTVKCSKCGTFVPFREGYLSHGKLACRLCV